MLRIPQSPDTKSPPPLPPPSSSPRPATAAAAAASAAAAAASSGQPAARVDFDALAQWSGTGRVKRPRNKGHSHRKYRLGRWHSRSTSSWNPPTGAQPGPSGYQDNEQNSAISKLRYNNQSRKSIVSVDISYKPSDSRRSSVYGQAQGSASDQDASDLSDAYASDTDDEGNGPLAQILLRENDEIWNNSEYRFTFYSPATGTVRSTNVQTLRTDEAKGLDALIRQATSSTPKTSNPSLCSSEAAVMPEGALPQLSVTGVPSSPSPSADATANAESAGYPDNGFLHPNDALDNGARRRRNNVSSGIGISAGSDADVDGIPASGDDDAELGSSPKLFWLDIMDPTESEIVALSRIFDLHPLTTEELLLAKDDAAVQDSCKSFRHYDIICYRTSITPFASSDVTSNGGDAAVLPGAQGFKNDVADASKEKPFIRGIAGRVHANDIEKLDTSSSADLSIQKAKKTGLFASLGQKLRRLTRRPELEDVPVPEIKIPLSRRNSVDGIGDPDRGLAQDMQDDILDESVPFYTIVLANGVITLHRHNLPHVRNTVARLLLDEDLIYLTPDYISYLLLDDITDTLVPTTRLLELEVDAVDELVLILTRAEHDDVLKRIGIERRHALWLVRLLHGKAEVLRAIERRVHAKIAAAKGVASSPYRLQRKPRHRRKQSAGLNADDDFDNEGDELESQLLTSDEEEGELYGWSRKADRNDDDSDVQHVSSADGARQALPSAQFLPDVTKYLADVQDHLLALTGSVHHCERILARAHGNYLARINLELTHASNTTNQLATQMTVLAGIFLPLNLVAGIFGMNVKVPGRDRDDLVDFGIIVGCMAGFALLALAVCKWRRII
ncbi:CorA metal ion transporter [Dipsacomyces acuminosporus]|nr:CorA metal ion transporter [Dipsacomyces acuminosporus]